MLTEKVVNYALKDRGMTMEPIERFKALVDLNTHWATTARTAFQWPSAYMPYSWEEYAYEYGSDCPESHRNQLSQSPTTMHYLESLNSGFPLDVKSIDASHLQWYNEPLPYKIDCALLLMKILINMRWARQHNNPLLINTGLGFPLMDYTMGIGPTIPEKEAQFGRRDRQIAVTVGKVTYYFEPKGTNPGAGTVMSITTF